MFRKIKVDGWTFDAPLISEGDLVHKHGIQPMALALASSVYRTLIVLKANNDLVYPVFQFNQTHKKHWGAYEILGDVNPILLMGRKTQATALAACHWWLTPHVELDNETPASIIGNPRESDLVQLAAKTIG